jgi:thiol:disulfide interchange protein DsbD
MWMVWVRKLFALLLIGVALYFLLPQLSRINDPLGFILGLLAVFSGLLLGFLDHSPGYSRAFKLGRALFGIVVLILGVLWMDGAIKSQPSKIDWIHYRGQTLEQLMAEGKPLFFDFYADWCAPCKQLDRLTFSDDAVAERSASFTMVKVDCTAPDDATLELMEFFRVSGMPTLIFLSKSGTELEELREIGFIAAEPFLASMEKTLSAE